MFKKAVLFVTILAMVVLGGAVSVFAQDTDTGCQVYSADEGVAVPAYCDGRINAFDIMQPVAIYYTMEDGNAVNDDGESYPTQVITGIALWGIDGEGSGYLALWVGIDEIEAAMAAAQASGENVQLGAAYGLTLNYVPEVNMFWVTAPSYSFSWDAW